MTLAASAPSRAAFRLQSGVLREHLGERVSGDPPDDAVPESQYAGRARSASITPRSPIESPDAISRITGHRADSREPSRRNHIDGVRWISETKEPLVGGDVQTVDDAGKLVELFVVDVGEYRNTAECSSRISRAPLGRLPLDAHGVRLLRNTLEPGQVVVA